MTREFGENFRRMMSKPCSNYQPRIQFMNGPPPQTPYTGTRPVSSSQFRQRKASKFALNLPIFDVVWRLSGSCWSRFVDHQ